MTDQTDREESAEQMFNSALAALRNAYAQHVSDLADDIVANVRDGSIEG